MRTIRTVKDMIDIGAAPMGALATKADDNMEIQNMVGIPPPPAGELAAGVDAETVTESCILAYVIVFIVLALLVWLATRFMN